MASGTAALPDPDEAKASAPPVWLDMDRQALDDSWAVDCCDQAREAERQRAGWCRPRRPSRSTIDRQTRGGPLSQASAGLDPTLSPAAFDRSHLFSASCPLTLPTAKTPPTCREKRTTWKRPIGR